MHNYEPNRGAHGTFTGPVTFNQGSVDARNADFSGTQGVTIAGVTINHKRQQDESNADG